MSAKEYMSLKTQREWKDYLQRLVRTNDKALMRAVVVIHDSQTEEEQRLGTSIERNGVGFTRWDVEEMSDIAVKIKRGSKLSDNEIVRARIVMPKYWRQLMVISKRNISVMLEREVAMCSMRNQVSSDIEMCMDHGTPCYYGICDECPSRLCTG